MHVTPKVEQLMRSKHIQTVNEMLDNGSSPNSVHRYLLSVGFKISAPTVYRYSELRRNGMLGATAENTPAAESDVQMLPVDDTVRDRLMTELHALDMLIEKGYQAIQEMPPEDVTPKLMMDAIRLKNELTGGSHATLTEYGFRELKKLEATCVQLVVQYMLKFVDEDKQAEVLRAIAEIEERVYAGTPWQAEYEKVRLMNG